MPSALRDRLVWGVHEAALQRHGVEAALEAAEAAAAAGGTAYWGADAALRARKAAALDVQSELDNLYVEVGGLVTSRALLTLHSQLCISKSANS
jgi:hypothetical protein